MINTSASLALQYDSTFSPFCAVEIDEGLLWIKENGFNGVELIISTPATVDIDDLNQKLEGNKLKVSTIATGQCVMLEGISLTDPSKEIRARAVKRLFEHIDLSTKIGFPNVTVGLIRGKNGITKKIEHMKILRNELVKCCEYAVAKNVIINLEPINRYEAALLNSCEETYDFIEELGFPNNVGILFDTFHANIEDKNVVRVIKRIGRRISHVHFADSNRRLPGEGHLNFKSIVQSLQKVQYSGYVSLEVLNMPNKEWIIKAAALSFKKMNLL